MHILGVAARPVAEGRVDQLGADLDELPAPPGGMDGAAILAGVDDADHRRQQLRQVADAPDLVQNPGVFVIRPQGEHIDQPAAVDDLRHIGVDAAINRVGEMLRPQEAAQGID